MGRELTVPLFPLPGTVVFPGVTLPFYVFEPRYRAMLADALDAGGLIGVPMLLPGFEGSDAGLPPIAAMFGVGSIEDYVTHPDGTSHVAILGRWTVRLIEELPPVAAGPPGTLYRRARVEKVAEPLASDAERETLRRSWRDALECPGAAALD